MWALTRRFILHLRQVTIRNSNFLFNFHRDPLPAAGSRGRDLYLEQEMLSANYRETMTSGSSVDEINHKKNTQRRGATSRKPPEPELAALLGLQAPLPACPLRECVAFVPRGVPGAVAVPRPLRQQGQEPVPVNGHVSKPQAQRQPAASSGAASGRSPWSLWPARTVQLGRSCRPPVPASPVTFPKRETEAQRG